MEKKVIGGGLITKQRKGNLFLDKLSVIPQAAFSVSRKLRTASTLPLITVRRSSDNLLLDISALSNNELDLQSLLNFCGGGSGFIHRLYDNTGNNNHATQSNVARQPRIVNNGVLETLNGKPAMRFLGNGWMNMPSSILANKTAYALNFVANFESINAWEVLFSQTTSDSFLQIRRQGTDQSLQVVDGGTVFTDNGLSANTNETAGLSDTCGITVNRNNLNLSININSNSKSFVLPSNTSVLNTAAQIGTRASGGGAFFVGTVSECLMYPTTIFDVDLGILHTDQIEYYAI